MKDNCKIQGINLPLQLLVGSHFGSLLYHCFPDIEAGLLMQGFEHPAMAQLRLQAYHEQDVICRTLFEGFDLDLEQTVKFKPK